MTRRDEAVQILTRIVRGGLGNIIDDAQLLRGLVASEQNAETRIDDSIDEESWTRLRDLSDSLNHTLHLWSGGSARSPKARYLGHCQSDSIERRKLVKKLYTVRAIAKDMNRVRPSVSQDLQKLLTESANSMQEVVRDYEQNLIDADRDVQNYYRDVVRHHNGLIVEDE